MTETAISGRVASLREKFVRSFVEVPHFDPVATEDLLAVHVGGQPHALRLAEIKGFHADKKVTALPSGVPGLRGVAAFRGVMLPVYDLATLLGLAPSKAPRWIAVAAAAPVTFAFDGFDGHLRCPSEAITESSSSSDRRHLSGVAHTEGRMCPIVDLPSVVAAVRQRVALAGPE